MGLISEVESYAECSVTVAESDRQGALRFTEVLAKGG